MSDFFWKMFFECVGSIIIAYFVYKTKQAVEKSGKDAEKTAGKAAVEVKEVKNDLKDLAVVAEKTHTLVNSKMGIQLKLSAIALRRLALITKDPEDVQAAEIAEQLLKEHEQKQATVDAGNKT